MVAEHISIIIVIASCFLLIFTGLQDIRKILFKLYSGKHVTSAEYNHAEMRVIFSFLIIVLFSLFVSWI